jgi:hypothetical protein
MIFLDYHIEPAELSKLGAIDLTRITATQLDYYVFCGDIVFQIDDLVFDARWGWVPIVDFATQLFCNLKEISDGECKSLEFTESDATLQFTRSGEEIEIVGSYCSSRARVRLWDMREAAKGFFARVMSDLTTKWPELSRNDAFRERMEMLRQKK